MTLCQVDIAVPEVFVGGLLGAGIVFLFTAYSVRFLSLTSSLTSSLTLSRIVLACGDCVNALVYKCLQILST